MVMISENARKSKNASPLSSTQKVESSSFVINTLNRLLTHQSNKEEKIKTKQIEKYKTTLSQLTDKPTINPKSKELVSFNQCPYTVSPLYIRTQIEINDKERKLKETLQQKSEEDHKNYLQTCTFSPNSINTISRDHNQFVEDCFKWSTIRSQRLKINQEAKEKAELLLLTERPSISKNSERIACKVMIQLEKSYSNYRETQ